MHRKDSKLRLIFDPRTANDKCQAPPRTSLPSAASLAQLETSADDDVHMASGDVEVAFYQYSIPLWLQRHFALPAIRWKFLPHRLRERFRHMELDGAFHFVVRVLPMGLSWSVFSCSSPTLIE